MANKMNIKYILGSWHYILLHHHSHLRDNVTALHGRPNLRSRLHSCHAQEERPRRPQAHVGAIGRGEKTLCIDIDIFILSGPRSSVDIATELRAGRSGIESRCGRDFPPVKTSFGAHPASCKTGTGSFPGVKSGRGVLLTFHPLLVSRSWKSRAIPLPTLWATPGL